MYVSNPQSCEPLKVLQLAAVHLFLYVKVAPGKHFHLGTNSFNSDTNAAAATGAAAGAAAASAAASAACIYYEVLVGGFAPTWKFVIRYMQQKQQQKQQQ